MAANDQRLRESDTDAPTPDDLARLTGMNPAEAERNIRTQEDDDFARSLGFTPEDEREMEDNALGLDDLDEQEIERNARESGAADSGFSPEALGDMESQGDSGGGFYRGDEQEGAALAGAVGTAGASGDIGAAATDGGGAGPGKFGAAMRGVASIASRRSTQVGGGVGGVVAIVIAFFAFTGTQLEFVHIRENMLGRANSIVNQALSNRRHQNFYKIVKRFNEGKLSDKLTSEKFKSKLEEQGFKVTAEKGKITSLSYDVTDEAGKVHTSAVDLTAKDAEAQFHSMFNDPHVGQEASIKMDKAMGGVGATVKGLAARLQLTRIGAWFTDWTSRTPSDKAQTPEAELADDLRHAVADQDAAAAASGGLSDSALQQNNTDPKSKDKVVIDDTVRQAADGAAEYRQQLLDDPNNQGIENGAADAAVEAAEKAGGDVVKAAEEAATKNAGKTLGGAALKSLMITGYYQTACTINGTLKFVSNIQNILLTIELAKFSLRFLMVADSDKASVALSEGMKLYALYLNNPNPVTGVSGVQSGAMRHEIFGDPNAHESAVNIGKLSTSRAPRGILGQISHYLDSFMQGIGGASGCRIVNNGWVQAGSLIVGIGVAIFTGGVSALAESIPNVILGILGQVALEVGKAILIKSVSGMVFNGFESGDLVGAGIAAGWGAQRGMNGNANALRPATRAKAAALAKQADATQQYVLAHQSLYDRYINPQNGNSALDTIATTVVPYTSHPSLIANALIQGIGKLPANLFGALGISTPKAFADGADASCDDPNHKIIEPNDLQTDEFCNLEFADAPELNQDDNEKILTTNGMIDDKGSAVQDSEYSDYIDLCLSGRPGILYKPKVADNGDDEGPAVFDYKITTPGMSDHVDNPCIVSGAPLPGDTVGRFDRYTSWYGYKVDETNLVESFTDDYGQVPPALNDKTSGNNYYQPNPTAACATGTNDLGVNTGYADGQPIQIKLCGIPNIPSSGEESTPGSKYYIQGANNHVIVNASVSKNFLDLGNAAGHGAASLSASSSFRTMAHQQDLCNTDSHHPGCSSTPADYSYVAKPGTSNHQMGLAVDFNMPTKPETSSSCVMTGGGVCTLPGDPVWDWLTNNAANYGIYQYAKEFWHWSITGT